MNKQNTMSLRIEKPCTECWSSMINNDLGKYCPVCKTDVLDFRDLKDNEILDILKQTKGKVCGRFRQSQLNRPLIFNDKKEAPRSPRFAKMLVAVALLYSSTNSSAQERVGSDIVIQKDLIAMDSLKLRKVQEEIDTKNSILQGTIFYEQDKDPLIGVTVVIKNTNIGAISDTEGNYQLVIPDTLMNKDKITVLFNFIGCETQTITYETDKIPKLENIYMKEDSSILMGEVMIVPYATRYSDPIYDKRKKK